MRSYRTGHNGRAFTLIELLLVLVILAVLASLAIPRFAGRREQAKLTKAKADIAAIEVALGSFEVDCGRYPTSDEGLKALVERPGDLAGWSGSYLMKGIPLDSWDLPYVYRCPGQHNADGYDLYSSGPDKQDGTADDITSWQQ